MSTTNELDLERAHLSATRATLREMRRSTQVLQDNGISGGDAVATEALRRTLWERMRSLEDDPQTPPFFGRLDCSTALGAEHDERLYVGRRHVSAAAGEDPMVIDWRAPMSLPFYRASTHDPMGVRLRRRFGFDQGELTAFEDELLESGEVSDPGLAASLLDAEIERPRTGPMRDIVATIQPEQDVLVRADLARSICIQGAPGTGKTAVGLHRAAYLLFTFRRQLSRSGVLVIGPNSSFLDHIGDVLPALGEIDARSETLESLLSKESGHEVRAAESTEAAVLKGDPRMARVLHRALWSRIEDPKTALVVPRGTRQWRVPAQEVSEVIEELRHRGVRYGAARQLLATRLAHLIMVRLELAGESPDDRVQEAIARSRAMKSYCAEVWPAVRPDQLVWQLLTDPRVRAEACEGVLDADEQSSLQPHRPARTARSMRWTPADLPLLDEARDLLERTPSLGHVILDEAQDLSGMQLRAVGRRASTGSLTLLGDLAQTTTPWGSRSWQQSLAQLGIPDAEVHELVAGFRVPGAVIDLAARLLPVIAPGLRPPHSVRRSRGDLTIVPGDPLQQLSAIIHDLVRRAGTVGIIAADADVAGLGEMLTAAGIHAPRIDAPRVEDDAPASTVVLVPATLAKGLEFDHVVLVEPESLVAAEVDRVTGLRRLYVCLTRAVTSLTVLHDAELPQELTRPVGDQS